MLKMAFSKPLLAAALYACSCITIAAPLTLTGSAEDKGLTIAKAADARDTGYIDTQVNVQMILRDKRGKERTRDLRINTLEVQEDGDKSLITFDSPKDQRGTKLLSFSHKVGDDDQWLYLPALKRVKRIASKNKSGPFVGSEFSFEDLASQEVEKYTYKYLRDEACGELKCYVMERFPVDKNSGYTKQVVWIDQEELRLIKVDYFDRKRSLLKTLVFDKYEQYEGQFWRPGDMFMENYQTGKSTRLVWQEYKFKTGLADKDFSRNKLKRR